jgi:hypothetical protein
MKIVYFVSVEDTYIIINGEWKLVANLNDRHKCIRKNILAISCFGSFTFYF